MSTTHAFVGAALGLAAAAATPVPTGPALLVGAIGGALPDADLLATHRRSLHFPVGYAILAGVSVVLATVLATTPATLLALAVAAAALHCAMDVFGGGVEARPWEATSDRGVYNHLTGRWIGPRRWVRYAGAPEDLCLALVAGLPLLAVTSGRARVALGALLLCSVLFAVYRRRFALLDERVAG